MLHGCLFEHVCVCDGPLRERLSIAIVVSIFKLLVNIHVPAAARRLCGGYGMLGCMGDSSFHSAGSTDLEETFGFRGNKLARKNLFQSGLHKSAYFLANIVRQQTFSIHAFINRLLHTFNNRRHKLLSSPVLCAME